MHSAQKKLAVLVDLPTHPKGMRTLSLSVVATCLSSECDTAIVDRNIQPETAIFALLSGVRPIVFCGLKVCAQNEPLARALTEKIHARTGVPVVWGGELPTLLPSRALESADTIVCGRFEPVAEAFLADLKSGQLKPQYASPGGLHPGVIPKLHDTAAASGAYFSFMGQPLESSRGCPFGCTFCLVHVMQPEEALREAHAIRLDLDNNPRHFVNIVDYNVAQKRSHLLHLAAELARSKATGWMGEACIESLDDDEVLEALRASRCRIVYCGLESLSDLSLRSVAKGQNHASEYARIIRKAQSYGIEIAAGVILGLEGTTKESFDRLIAFLEEAGIIYVKLTSTLR